MSAERELLPCPFCERNEFVTLRDFEGHCSNCGYGKWGRTVVCNAAGLEGVPRGCGASIGYCETDEEAIAAWNRRATPQPGRDSVIKPLWFRENWHEAMMAFKEWIWSDQHREPNYRDGFIAGAEWQRALCGKDKP